MALDLNTKFKNSSEIDAFFNKTVSSTYVEWFNSKHASKDYFKDKGKIKSATKWQSVWNNIESIYGKKEINLVEFIAINTIIINETGSTFEPKSENVGSKGHSGLAYAFDTISGVKRSYNTLTDVKNKTAFALYNDADYIKAHSQKPFGDILKNTTDNRWASNTFPQGFSNDVEKETSKNAADNSFIAEADFNKFRGRGFIQTTGRANYIGIIKYILEYSGNNSKISNYKSKWNSYGTNYDLIASVSTNADWDDLFQNTDNVIACVGIQIHGQKSKYYNIDATQNEQKVRQSVKNVASKIAGANANAYIDKYIGRVYQQLSVLETAADEDATPAPTPTSNQSNTPTAQDNSESNDAANSQRGNIPKISGITNFFKPSINIDPINIKFVDKRVDVKREFSYSLGYTPYVDYNGFQIEPNAITSLVIANDGLLPIIKMSFSDQLSIFVDKGFPLDDTKIKIFLNSKSKTLKSIMMEFKITKFNINNGQCILSGVCNINELFISRFKTYPHKSSFETLKQIAKDAGLGFNSNVNGSNDKMTWINHGIQGYKFIQDVTLKSYISDETFVWVYIDMYYNLNYIDVDNALRQNAQSLKGINNMGYDNVPSFKLGNKEKVNSLFLTTDKSLQNSPYFISSWSVINKSTLISLERGYMNTVKYYDLNKKDISIFDIDSITSEGDNTIILKGNPTDEAYFNENVRTEYVGKLDTDNMHKNYNYSRIQNEQNIHDLQKIGINVTIPKPNYNLLRFMKLKLYIVDDTATPSSDIINRRLSGDWLIIDIKYVMIDGEYVQKVTLVKRELELSPDERNSQVSPSALNSTAQQTSDTQSTEESNEPNPDPVEDTTQNTPPEPEPVAATQSTAAGGSQSTAATQSTATTGTDANGNSSTGKKYTYKVVSQGPKKKCEAYDNGKLIYTGQPSTSMTAADLIDEAKIALDDK